MRVEHRLTVVARCPVDDSFDVYKVTVETDRVLLVEEILLAVKRLTVEQVYQEELTQSLAAEFEATVTTYGCHSGIDTVCEAP